MGLVAQALKKSGRPERALEVLGRALREHPDDFWLHFVAAKANRSSRPPRDDEAIRHYTAALALRPRSVAVLNNLGIAEDQGKPDEAIACYRKAIEIDPKFAMAHGNLGIALELQGKLDEAIACYRKAIELDPKHASAHINLGVALHEQGKLDEAIACYRKAIESTRNWIGPQSPRTLPDELSLRPTPTSACPEGSGEAGRGHRLLPQGHRTRSETYRGLHQSLPRAGSTRASGPRPRRCAAPP